MAKVAQDVEPTYFEEAAENVKWQEVMDEEMDALYGNETWDLVPLPKGKKPIGSQWVYKVKHDSDGSVSSYKARLVAKGYAQTHGIGYEKTFSSMAKMAIVRAIIAVAAAKGWILHQQDVKNAFLHVDLQEEVYMEQTPGFQDTGHPNYVYADHLLYLQKKEIEIVIITIYVDDLIIGGDALKDVEHGKALLCKQFDMKDLGELAIFWGLKRYAMKNLKLRIDEAEVLDDATMYRTQVQVHGYTDFYWADSSSYRQSTSFYMFSFGSAAVTWSSKKQPTIALLSTEAKYRGAAVVACEVAWLEMLLQDLEV
ncbi:hypothetical protein L7F22_034977 [Adiantum nelumboides]|nr:hypothetical protein [Adiantum nelumboides]